MIVAAVTTAFWLAVWRPWQLPRFKHIFTCLFSYATCVVVKNSAAPVFAWVRWHGQSHAPARRQRRRVANWQQRCVRAAAASLGCGSLHGTIAACFAYACSAFCTVQKKSCIKRREAMCAPGCASLGTPLPCALTTQRFAHVYAPVQHARYTR